MLTGHGTVEMCRRAFKAGAAEFLEKPVDDEPLLEALQNAVRQHVRSRERNAADREARERYAQLSEREREVLGADRRRAHQQGDRPRARRCRRARSRRTAPTCSPSCEAESLAQLIRRYAALVDERRRAAQ